MENSMIQSAHPCIRLVACEGSHVESVERGMENCDLLPIVDEYAALLGSDEEMSRWDGQDRGDGSRFRAGGKNLAEGTAVEGKDSVVGGGNDQFRLVSVGENCGSERNQRRTGEFAADRVLVKQDPGDVVLLQSGGARNIKMILKTRGLQKDRRRADSFEAGIDRRGQRANDEAKLVFRADIFGSGAKCARAPP